jgi:hypothetical protein
VCIVTHLVGRDNGACPGPKIGAGPETSPEPALFRRDGRRSTVGDVNDSFDTPVTEALLEELLDEIGRYLDVVETFRREGCEPRWQDAPAPSFDATL